MAVREKRNKCGFKGLNRDAVSRGRHEERAGLMERAASAGAPRARGQWASRRTRSLGRGRPEGPRRPSRPAPRAPQRRRRLPGRSRPGRGPPLIGCAAGRKYAAVTGLSGSRGAASFRRRAAAAAAAGPGELGTRWGRGMGSPGALELGVAGGCSRCLRMSELPRGCLHSPRARAREKGRPRRPGFQDRAGPLRRGALYQALEPAVGETDLWQAA